jgi:4-hydroxybenzoyl-CoA reductase subunit alpha
MTMGGHNSQSDLKLIGTVMRKIEGLDKSTGRALYTDDLVFPGMLHGKILRSPHPHARIVSIDTAGARALEGVHGVITGQDMPTRYGVIPWTPDEYPLCLDRVDTSGMAWLRWLRWTRTPRFVRSS